jgi:DNA modification methylase
MDYKTFIKSKKKAFEPVGIEPQEPNPMLFPFQRDIVKWALRRGRACIWADCGLGKSFMQLEWAKQIPGHVLIVAPLGVALQTANEEAPKLGLRAKYCRDMSEVETGITICNYEMLHKFDASKFNGVVLDESSAIKHKDSATRNMILEMFDRTPFKLACTATPAPNDHMELGNHSQFVGAMTLTEMLSMYFVHDGGETQKWRLKGHAESKFWEWVASWAVMLRKPSDLGYDDGDFVLPKLNVEQVSVESNVTGDDLFSAEAKTLVERRKARKDSIQDRVQLCSDLVSRASDEQCIVWCGLNNEGDAIEKSIKGSVQVSGSDSIEFKEEAIKNFRSGKIRVLISKVSIFGFGLNLQNCRNVFFLGLSDSFEEYYQAVRRNWRFGQKKEVNVKVITSTAEGAVVKNIARKEADAEKMANEMVSYMHSINEKNIKKIQVLGSEKRNETVHSGKDFDIYLGDCVDVVGKLEDDSIDFTIYSPPFSSLYVYSNSDRDMGNSASDDEFHKHFAFLAKELFRVTRPGRLMSFHCMNLPTSKVRDGFIGIRDFRGELIRLFESCGFIFHSEVCIWKDPVTAMQRTKALGLLHKQMVKDSCMSRQGIPDYLVTMRKPGENTKPVSGELDRWVGDESFKSNGRLSIDLWQRYASPVWMDIRPGRTLQKGSARDEKDERHICPLQLDVIERALELWSNPGDTVLSPFTGIGSEGYCAIQMGRKFIGAELKESYWKQAVLNLERAKAEKSDSVFDLAEATCE